MKTNMNLIEVANFFNMVLWSCLVSDHDDILFQSALSDMLGNMLVSLALAENYHFIIRALYLSNIGNYKSNFCLTAISIIN